MAKLRIKDWAQHFETAKSKTYKRTNKVCVPNKIGVGLGHILSLPDGAAVFGVFILIAEAVSTQLGPRAGYLTDNGRKNGREWSEKDIAVRIRRPVEEISRCLQVCMSPEVAWIEQYPCTIPAVSAEYPSVCIESEYVLSKLKTPTESLSAFADASTPQPEKTHVDSKPGKSFPEGFIQFWSRYPIRGRSRSGRKASFAEWQRQKLESKVDEVLEGLLKWEQTEDWKKEGGQFIPGADRWLKRQLWQDPPEPVNAESNHQCDAFAVVYPTLEQALSPGEKL